MKDEGEVAFAARIAHELRGAVGALALRAAAVAVDADELGNPDLAGALRQLALQADHLQAMSLQLLDLAHLERNDPYIEHKPVSVSALVRSLLADESPELGDKVEMRIADDLSIESNPIVLGRILSNLMRNAHNYGGDQIQIVGHRVDGQCFLSVVDNGPGVPDAIRDDVFEPFTRGTSKTDGAGLGLAIVAELAHLLGGNVDYQPAIPSGARFTVTLPAH